MDIELLTTSPFFHGFIAIFMNLGSRYILGEFPKGVELFFQQNEWLRYVVVFCVLYMPIRNIKMTAFFMLLFILVTKYLCNEKSRLCMIHLPTPSSKKPELSEHHYKLAKDYIQQYEMETAISKKL